MKICLVENDFSDESYAKIISYISKLYEDKTDYKVIIISRDVFKNFPHRIWHDEKQKINYYDLLLNKKEIEVFLRKGEGIVFINFFGSEEKEKQNFISCLAEYIEYLEQKIQYLIMIDEERVLPKIAMTIESYLYINSLNWKEKDYERLIKRQKKEIFRFSYIYDTKYIFSIFKFVGLIKRKLGLIR